MLRDLVPFALLLATAACSGAEIAEGESSPDTLGSDGPEETTSGEPLTTSITIGESTTTSSTTDDPSTTAPQTSTGSESGEGCMEPEDCPDADGNPCSIPTCDGGVCTEEPVDCSNPQNQCAVGSCDPASGTCVYEADNSICEADECSMGTCEIELDGNGNFVSAGCTIGARDGEPCDDEDACTSADVCAEGQCSGEALVCDDAPANTCNGNVLETYTAEGLCSEGDCDYMQSEVPCPSGCSGGMCNPPSYPVISEVLYDDDGGDDNVWIELWVPDGTDLSTLRLDAVNGNGGTVYRTFTLSGTVPADNIVLVVDTAATDAGLIAAADFVDDIGDLQNGPDSLRLLRNDTEVDAIAYGTFSDGDIFAGEGNPAPGVSTDSSLARSLTFFDSNDNVSDFSEDTTPTPGAFNDG